MSSNLSFVHHEVSVSITELDMIEVTIDGIITFSSSEVELEFGWWSIVINMRNSNSFVVFFTNEGRICFGFGGGISGIDIEPMSINFGIFEVN